MHQIVAPRLHEEALESWREAGDSMGGLLERHGIEIREFVILSYLCEHADLTVQQIAEGVSLSGTTVDFCVSQLGKARLARQTNEPGGRQPLQIVATRKGKYLVRRANGAVA